MQVVEFLKLLAACRKKHGYVFEFGVQCRMVPRDNPARFVVKEAQCIRWRLPEEAGDPRLLLPYEAVWHCYFREDADLHVPTGSCEEVWDLLGVPSPRRYNIICAGEEYHASFLKGHPKLKKIKAMRRDLLKACGLEEIPKRRIWATRPREPDPLEGQGAYSHLVG